MTEQKPQCLTRHLLALTTADETVSALVSTQQDVRLLNSPHPQPHEQQDFQAAAPPGGMHQNCTHYFGTCVCTNLCSMELNIAVVDPKWYALFTFFKIPEVSRAVAKVAVRTLFEFSADKSVDDPGI
ncbi:hypothetical protein Bbelb_184160 [Branchiostoma belcheri]|nr:hypothetical protein Bbelb_184160 [Branchiostoma belcheri]